ncbi:hypothetical protein GH714_011273 [Hevea brasiliensis]|uniref:Uncharacterized protein n=1 Tax=Hevea brasiliensis TaxID=3981 RepID=A0A6A6MYZ6_HEVBR|nr:hypothetical protein GH714_011273 [Hevea brasiliensis]
MLLGPLITGRVGKWALELTEFSLAYHPQNAIKGPALVDFLANHPCLDVTGVEGGLEVNEIEISLQLSKEYKCNSIALAPYFAVAIRLLESFEGTEFERQLWESNWEANELAQATSGLRISEDLTYRVLVFQKR